MPNSASVRKPKTQPTKCKPESEAVYDIIKKIKQSHKAMDKKMKDIVHFCTTKNSKD
jgi:hypothetical protein